MVVRVMVLKHIIVIGTLYFFPIGGPPMLTSTLIPCVRFIKFLRFLGALALIPIHREVLVFPSLVKWLVGWLLSR